MEKKLEKVLLLGSGALKIGEAGEFDYSGSQAIKALKEEGIFTVLVNPNIATIQTSDHLADRIYFLPVTASFVERIIEKERPDGILMGFGGQTALQCGIELEERGVLDRHGVAVLGTSVQTILETEDRDLFVKKLSEIDAHVPLSIATDSVSGALLAADKIGYPVMLRVAYALGGLGSGLCADAKALRDKAGRALSLSPQLLIEEYLAGWKEVEYEVVRDRFDNCVTVCNMENLDPMGIHTGESIVVAPSQTLTDGDYHLLRNVSIRVVRHLGVVGECNVQFALDPHTGTYRVIEVNARLSRSSALASKATGYPLAAVAAKLSLGYGLTDLTNAVTGVTSACFEPALDYVVVKIPRWDLEKFQGASPRIGSGMKSVGEVMAIGRKFEEALQKALRMLQIGVCGLVGNGGRFTYTDLEGELRDPTHCRIFAIPEALKSGHTVDDIHRLSRIDPWFLHKIANIVHIAQGLEGCRDIEASRTLFLGAKQAGFSDLQIARLTKTTEPVVRKYRDALGIAVCIKQIDTLAAEYPARTNYLYLTYNGETDDIPSGAVNQVIVLGSGAYSIGSSVEFDWCCVHTVMTLRKLGYRTIVINYNPETVSTDYNECDKLYFDELSLETVLAICAKENPVGVIIAMGGQVPNNLAMGLHDAGVRVLGTWPKNIDRAEDRKKFSQMLDGLGVGQPEWKELSSLEMARDFAGSVGYPVIVRPSYVISGSAMGVAANDTEMDGVLRGVRRVSREYPIVMSKFIENAKEIDVDAVASKGKLVAWALCEHVENAGVHSGDATLVLPPQRIYLETVRRIRKIAEKIAASLEINGPFNIQFIARGNEVKVIECNLRASRSFPFVSKIMKVNFIDLATRIIMGEAIPDLNHSFFELDHVGVKAPQFSFTRIDGADPTLGVEMTSTGEVGCLGDDFEEAFLKAMLSVGYNLSLDNVLLSTGPATAKAAFLESAALLKNLGVRIFASHGTANFLAAAGIGVTALHWPLTRKSPNIMEYIGGGRIDLVINIPKDYQEQELTNGYMIRRQAANFGIPLITNIQLAQRFVEAISCKDLDSLRVKSWDQYGR